MSEAADQYEHMKNCMTEFNTLECVQYGADCIGDAASRKPPYAIGRQAFSHGAYDENHHPPHGHIHRRRQHRESAGKKEFETDAAERHGPDNSEDDVAESTIKSCQCEWRIGASDQNVDGGMIN